MLKESLLAAVLTFPSWHGDEEPIADRSARLETIVEAIEIASAQAVCADGAQSGEDAPQDERSECVPLWSGGRRELSFLLLTQAFFETRLALHVHQGKCRSHLGECDSGKATSLWQLQAGGHLPKARWERLAGTSLEATTRAALEAARALGRGRNYCGSVEGAVSLYATGRTCKWEPAKKRVRFMKRLMARY